MNEKDMKSNAPQNILYRVICQPRNIVATFIANLCFDVNIMALIVIDGIIGFAFMRDKKYD